jgi:hypothetical protein
MPARGSRVPGVATGAHRGGTLTSTERPKMTSDPSDPPEAASRPAASRNVTRAPQSPLERTRSALTDWIRGPRLAVACDLACLLTIVYALVTYWRAISDVWLVGPDLFHIMVASKLGDGRSLFDVVSNTITPHLNFYRPLTSFLFAMDQAAWGMDAVGYQAGNLAGFGFCLTAFWLLCRRYLGEVAGGVGALLALVAFAFHPLVWDVVPYIERRSECTMAGFAMLALRAQAGPRHGQAGRFPLSPAVWSLLAMSAKDSALALIPVYFLAALSRPDAGAFAPRLRAAVQAMLPHAALASIFFVVRLGAIGGIGGDDATSLANFERFPVFLVDMLGMLLVPAAASEAQLDLAWGLTLAPLLGLIALVPWYRAIGLGASTGRDSSGWATRALLIFVPWMLIFAAAYTLRGIGITPWYVFGPMVAWSVLVGVFAEALVGRMLGGVGLQRLLALAALVALAGGLWRQSARSPVYTGDPHVEGISERERNFFAELERYILESPTGAVLEPPYIDHRYRSDLIMWVELMDFDRPVGVFRDRAEAAELGTEGLEVVVLYRNANER